MWRFHKRKWGIEKEEKEEEEDRFNVPLGKGN